MVLWWRGACPRRSCSRAANAGSAHAKVMLRPPGQGPAPSGGRLSASVPQYVARLRCRESGLERRARRPARSRERRQAAGSLGSAMTRQTEVQQGSPGCASAWPPARPRPRPPRPPALLFRCRSLVGGRPSCCRSTLPSSRRRLALSPAQAALSLASSSLSACGGNECRQVCRLCGTPPRSRQAVVGKTH